ncbi:MAG: imidazole glycerol phosphate synthase subunit HisH [Candidatus Omnitrophica bacterium]|nr:imidazole glycerol phosphate synthase subunit HisH [Candidatus Omnitrophota bacterium]
MKHSNKILIIDYGIGNHQSVANALDFLGYDFELSGELKAIREAAAYVLPGVGAIGEAMKNLQQRNIIEPLSQEVLGRKKPILGICLGMQMMAEFSEEGGHHPSLGWIPGRVVKLAPESGYRVPHVGWNTVHIHQRNPLFTKVDEGANFYFDHSYHFVCDEKYVAGSCSYGGLMTSAVRKDNIFGVQFHPEKSQNNGLKVFRSFFNYVEDLQRSEAYV